MPGDRDLRLRRARLHAALSQDTLARAAGLSRQAVGAIEAGRHRPSVDAAIALASALDRTVEELFGAPRAAPAVALFGRPVAAGTPVLTGRVGPQRVHAPADLLAWQERWPVADGCWTGTVVQTWGDDPRDEGFVVAGCDPALALAAAHLPAQGPQRLVAVSGSTRAALDALAAGRAHGALVHGRPGTLPGVPAGTLRLHLARWRVGLAAGGSRPPRSLTRLTHDAGDALVQREAGASSQQALLRALEAAGRPAPSGPVATGHLAVTMRVLAGAPAGVTMEPAAVHAQLAFLPLEEHTVELWVAPEHRDHPGCDALTQVLASRAFTRRLTAIGGYDLTGCGAALPEVAA